MGQRFFFFPGGGGEKHCDHPKVKIKLKCCNLLRVQYEIGWEGGSLETETLNIRDLKAPALTQRLRRGGFLLCFQEQRGNGGPQRRGGGSRPSRGCKERGERGAVVFKGLTGTF